MFAVFLRFSLQGGNRGFLEGQEKPWFVRAGVLDHVLKCIGMSAWHWMVFKKLSILNIDMEMDPHSCNE